ncbi:heme-binding protein [Paraburkholderia sp. BR14263]|uniref:heme-binding protein n=1 Tax=unclassified Paraburkholderia TaxID=2615204 RepID=UPI0034CFAD33
MSNTEPLTSTFSLPHNFFIQGVLEAKREPAAGVMLPANLGALAAFQGTFAGQGFNTIFRPDSAITPTPMPGPVTTTDPADNVLELNLTTETLSFSNNLVSIPNRGSGDQRDIFLNGVPYLQTINDVTTGQPVGIHFEPGLWLSVPLTTDPKEPTTLARMASIPHGTTLNAQGVSLPAIAGKPTIGAVDITPFVGGQPGNTIKFQNQTAVNEATRRIPQNLAAFINSGQITQAILDDPNTILRQQIEKQEITQTVVILISTKPESPLPRGPLPAGAEPSAPNIGGGTADIAFLQGQAAPAPGGPSSNANVPQMDAVFWIETVEYEVVVPAITSGSPPVILDPVQKGTVPLVPQFVAEIPFVPGKGFAGGKVKVATTQIQYSQKVILDFKGLSWPHVSVASLVPSSPIPIPSHLLPLT